MDRFLTVTETRQQLLRLLDEIKEGERVIITRRGKPMAVVMDFERHQLLAELARLWQDPQSLAHIRAAHEEASSGRVLHLKGPATVKRLVAMARSKGVFKRRGG